MMPRFFRSAHDSDEGMAIIELMLVMPILLILALAVWEFGRVQDALLIATNAAREGARYAAVQTMDPNITAHVKTQVNNYLQAGYGTRLGAGGDVSVQTNAITLRFFDRNGNAVTGPQPGYQVQVNVPVTAKVFSPIVPGLTDPITLTGSVSMQSQ